MSKNVAERLHRLPPKVGFPLRKLLAVGQLDEQTVETVLDAGELAGDCSKLVAFAAGLVYLESKGIPVRDVIGMAQKRRRKINLGWSPKRWQEEHERLSRYETLTRLAEQNVMYDVSLVRRHLPERFPGYVIRSSRRLGMEGLRQRHCVASYHSQILAGHCAIAAVFIDKRRWTVQLVPTGKAQAPLRIVQAKARDNRNPSKEVLARIYRALGLQEVEEGTPYARDGADVRHTYAENLRRVLPVLRNLGIERVVVLFDGSGDSGTIDRACYEPHVDGRDVWVEIRRVHRAFRQDRWHYAEAVEPATLDAAIEAIVDDYLEETNVNWYDNDGGFGELVIDVPAGTVSLDVSVRVTETTSAYSATRNIETGEEIEQ